VLANVLHVAELARQYERNDGLSFRGFVDAMRAAAAEGDAPDAPIVEEGADGVRVMTVHKAKGLEFPVVVLADITAKLAPGEASRWVDTASRRCALRLGGWAPWDLIRHQAEEQARDAAEGVRLAYVAATRARDVLVVPAVGDEPHDGGWVSPLNVALYPAVGARRNGGAADGCPTFGRDSVLERPEGALADAATVCPGLHQVSDAGGATHDVVWWDPSRLDLDTRPPIGLRRQELIAKDVPEAVVQQDIDAYRDWAATRAAVIATAARPSLQVLTTTEWAKRQAGADVGGDPPAVEIVEVARTEARPAGPRFGALVHAVLATARLEDATGLDAVAETQARLLGATADEIAPAIRVVEAVMRHELWRNARAVAIAGGADASVWRETAVTLTEGDTLLEGVVDLAYEQDGQVLVVDFKTDRAEGPVLAGYARQVSAYARAIGLALGKPTRAILLQV
jgi:ATP-dependent exoDNAse (exonuclease V) beta subunit